MSLNVHIFLLKYMYMNDLCVSDSIPSRVRTIILNMQLVDPLKDGPACDGGITPREPVSVSINQKYR